MDGPWRARRTGGSGTRQRPGPSLIKNSNNSNNSNNNNDSNSSNNNSNNSSK